MRDPNQQRIQVHRRYNRHWVLLGPYSYGELWILDRREYYATVSNEWVQRMNESNLLIKELCTLHASLPRCHSFIMPRKNLHEYIDTLMEIQKENNRVIIRKTWFFLLCIAQKNANDNGR